MSWYFALEWQTNDVLIFCLQSLSDSSVTTVNNWLSFVFQNSLFSCLKPLVFGFLFIPSITSLTSVHISVTLDVCKICNVFESCIGFLVHWDKIELINEPRVLFKLVGKTKRALKICLNFIDLPSKWILIELSSSWLRIRSPFSHILEFSLLVIFLLLAFKKESWNLTLCWNFILGKPSGNLNSTKNCM